MPIKLNSTGGGSVSIDVPSTASTYTLTAPARTGTIITTGDAGTITQGMIANNSISANTFASSGMILKTTSYCSGYGSGARTTSSSASWYTLSINGTSKDPYYPSDNANIRYFDKTRTGTHLRIKTHIPYYITPGGSGPGIRVQLVLSATPAIYNDGAQYTTIGPLTTGQAERWGAGGYGGDAAGFVTTYVDTQFSTNATNVLNYSGRVHFYFQGWTWSTGDTVYWMDYNDTYPKYGSWVVEEYIL